MRVPTLLSFLAVAVTLAAFAAPLIQRRVLRNWVYGLRTPATMANEQVWFEANARTGRHLAWLAAVVALAAVALYFVPRIPDRSYGLILAAVLALGALGAATRGWWFARKLWQQLGPASAR